jgi:hypothetical protein
MSINPHLYQLSKTLRSRSALQAATLVAARGGHFHRPDPRLGKPY